MRTTFGGIALIIELFFKQRTKAVYLGPAYFWPIDS